MEIVLTIVGLALILVGANYLTDGSAALARRFRISEFIVGLTVVAIGTSTPELIVSVMSAINGSGDMAVGNVTGSNLFNGLLILGVSALIAPVPLTANNVRKDIPFGVLASIILMVVCCDTILCSDATNNVGRDEGIMLLLLFVVFICYSIFSATGQQAEEDVSGRREKPLWLTLVMIVGGLAGLVFGGNLFQTNVAEMARSFGISESVIAITLMAGGTSLPELAASVVSAAKGKPEMAMGNVLGSNITNIFLVLGASATITPLSIAGISPIDLGAVLVASLLLWLTAFTFRRRVIDRAEGALLVLLYVGYIWYVVA